MSDFGLLSISATAFVEVFLLLSILAVLMKILMMVFPAPEASTDRIAGSVDPAVIAVITSAATTAFPGSRVTKIEVIQ
jgi:hypothetical protein